MAEPREHCVIVGAGHSAAQLCLSLRQADWSGRITLIGDEPHAPYHRPPLSKTALNPAQSDTRQPLRATSFYADNDIDLRLGVAVQRIDRDAKRIHLDNGELDYDTLVLATGSLHRRPPIPGVDDRRVFNLRTAADAEQVCAAATNGKRAAIIGGGFIGLEAAASLRKLGLDVVLFEMGDRVLARATSPQVSAYFHDLHRAHGVDLRLGRTVQQIDPTDAGLTLRGAGFAEEVDFAVIGIGASPNVALAEQCGLEIDDGIVVDEAARTSDSSVLAVGDCCNQHHAHYDRRVRLESVQNANDSAKLAAATIAGKPTPGKPTPGMTIPWFWSDQYDTKLQIVGLADGCDACVLRGKPEFGHSFSAWYLRDGELRAVDAINDGKAYIIGGKLIPRRVKPDLDVIADPQSNLKQLLTA